jgi:hypothetical protein
LILTFQFIISHKKLILLAEKPLKITKPLNDKYNCMEGDTLTLICEVNKPGVIAMWLKDGEQITVTDGYEITVDGCRHILTIPDATLDDEAEYTVMIGNEESTGLVLIEGNIEIILLVIYLRFFLQVEFHN